MNDVILLHGPSGNAYKLEPFRGGYCLQGAPILTDGSIEREGGPTSDYNWYDVAFDCIEAEQVTECRRIEAALMALRPAHEILQQKRDELRARGHLSCCCCGADLGVDDGYRDPDCMFCLAGELDRLDADEAGDFREAVERGDPTAIAWSEQ